MSSHWCRCLLLLTVINMTPILGSDQQRISTSVIHMRFGNVTATTMSLCLHGGHTKKSTRLTRKSNGNSSGMAPAVMLTLMEHFDAGQLCCCLLSVGQRVQLISVDVVNGVEG
jgi:hypothetical protein